MSQPTMSFLWRKLTLRVSLLLLQPLTRPQLVTQLWWSVWSHSECATGSTRPEPPCWSGQVTRRNGGADGLSCFCCAADIISVETQSVVTPRATHSEERRWERRREKGKEWEKGRRGDEWILSEEKGSTGWERSGREGKVRMRIFTFCWGLLPNSSQTAYF